MKFNEVENLSGECINQLYNDVVEQEKIDLLTGCYVYLKCDCNSGGRKYFQGYDASFVNCNHNFYQSSGSFAACNSCRCGTSVCAYYM